jgi:CDGSH-type Zn-finger protein
MDVFNGQCIGSYLGGGFNGQSGFNLQTQWMAQVETMLQVTGQPAILLRRKQSGRYCRCGSSDLRREHPNARCPHCFGTQFEQGYDRIFNSRAVSDQYRNSKGYILIRINPYIDDLKLDPANGLIQIVEQDAWTLAIPNIKDRDMIISFNQDFTEEFRYEVLNVTRNKLFFNQSGNVLMKLRRQDKTDIIMTYDIDDMSRFVKV